MADDTSAEEWHNPLVDIEQGISSIIEKWPEDQDSKGRWRLTQVVHKIMSVRKKWLDQYSRLRQENRHLQERVVALEHELAQSEDELAKSQDAVKRLNAQMEVIIVDD